MVINSILEITKQNIIKNIECFKEFLNKIQLNDFKINITIIQNINVILEDKTTVKLYKIALLEKNLLNTIDIKPWDFKNLSYIENSLNNAKLDFNIFRDKQKLKISFNKLTKDTREKYTRYIKVEYEKHKIIIRNLIKTMDEKIKNQKTLSEDNKKKLLEKLKKIKNESILVLEKYYTNKKNILEKINI